MEGWSWRGVRRKRYTLRADGAVDDASGEDGFRRRPPFPAHESRSENPTCRVEPFLIINGEWEEVPVLWFVTHDSCGHDCCVAVTQYDRSIGLICEIAELCGQCLAAYFERVFFLFHCVCAIPVGFRP